MSIIEKIADKVVDQPEQVHKRASWKISTGGALLGALGTGLSAGTSAANLSQILPEWAVWLGGAVICACVSLAMYIKQSHGRDDDADQAGA